MGGCQAATGRVFLISRREVLRLWEGKVGDSHSPG